MAVHVVLSSAVGAKGEGSPFPFAAGAGTVVLSADATPSRGRAQTADPKEISMKARTMAAVASTFALSVAAVPLTASPAAAVPHQSSYDVYTSSKAACDREVRHAHNQLRGQIVTHGKCYRSKSGWYASIIYRVR